MSRGLAHAVGVKRCNQGVSAELESPRPGISNETIHLEYGHDKQNCSELYAL